LLLFGALSFTSEGGGVDGEWGLGEMPCETCKGLAWVAPREASNACEEEVTLVEKWPNNEEASINTNSREN
jgi:hypothetical protein